MSTKVQTEFSKEEPLNREPPVHQLVKTFLTNDGEDDGYDRNHGAIPHIVESTHRVHVDGAVKYTLSLSVADLKKYPQHSVVCALQCAGNRRHTMRTKLKEVQGVDWFDGAVMNCRWEGPLLRDILQDSGIELSQKSWKDSHVAFACFQVKCQEDDWYGGSIPLDRAMRDSAEVILALRMNGKELTARHGFPVRCVVPGVAGARSVKWLDRITVQATESRNFYQQHDYKVLPPEVDSAEAAADWWSKIPAIQDMPINSVVAVPQPGNTITVDNNGLVEALGYALPNGEDGPVTKVEVSVDEGQTWSDAELLKNEDDGKWTWVLWRAQLRLEKGKGRTILSRATDKGCTVQGRQPEWNLRGVLYNGYGEAKDLEVV